MQSNCSPMKISFGEDKSPGISTQFPMAVICTEWPREVLMREMEAKGETRTWNWLGAMIGLIIGGLVAFGGILFFELWSSGQVYGMEASANAPLVAKFGIPIVLLVFGAAAGALIGNGTPRYNDHPEQGRGNAYHYIYPRRRRTT